MPSFGGFAKYGDYLESPHWRSMRAHFCRKGRFCYACRAIQDLQIHHLRYDNLGAEQPGDFIILCGSCHEQTHEALLKKYPSKSRGASAIFTYEVFPSLFGISLDAARDRAAHFAVCQKFYRHQQPAPAVIIKHDDKPGRRRRKRKNGKTKTMIRLEQTQEQNCTCRSCGRMTFLKVNKFPLCRICQAAGFKAQTARPTCRACRCNLRKTEREVCARCAHDALEAFRSLSPDKKNKHDIKAIRSLATRVPIDTSKSRRQQCINAWKEAMQANTPLK